MLGTNFLRFSSGFQALKTSFLPADFQRRHARATGIGQIALPVSFRRPEGPPGFSFLSVHLHWDKLLPQAEIRCLQPYQGLLTIQLRQACKVRVRIPEFVDPKEMAASSSRGRIKATAWGNYLELGDQPSGENLRVTYPVPVRLEEISIGNPGYRQYRYAVTWKGDTVVRMKPIGEQTTRGFSDFDNKPVEVYYGVDGPGPLYQREQMMEQSEPAPAKLHLDDGSLDFWFLQ
jgi:hypothetical protein